MALYISIYLFYYLLLAELHHVIDLQKSLWVAARLNIGIRKFHGFLAAEVQLSPLKNRLIFRNA